VARIFCVTADYKCLCESIAALRRQQRQTFSAFDLKLPSNCANIMPASAVNPNNIPSVRTARSISLVHRGAASVVLCARFVNSVPCGESTNKPSTTETQRSQGNAQRIKKYIDQLQSITGVRCRKNCGKLPFGSAAEAGYGCVVISPATQQLQVRRWGRFPAALSNPRG
jgi:hypothetical protein